LFQSEAATNAWTVLLFPNAKETAARYLVTSMTVGQCGNQSRQISRTGEALCFRPTLN
jgi:hypothetical protein